MLKALFKLKFLIAFGCLAGAIYLFFQKENHPFIDITKFGYEQYQDIVIHNKVVKKASGAYKDCAHRYQIIQQILNKYNRPFTLLDIGASQGYYSFRTAHDYNAVCVMIEGNNHHYPMIGTQLLDLCKANSHLDNIILLNKKIIPEDLVQLSECENFDVVLALNIIHWFGSRWKEVADAILNMGSAVIIETPPQETIIDPEYNAIRKAIEDYLIFRGAQVIGQVPRHTSPNIFANLYLIEAPKSTLIRKHWLEESYPSVMHEIVSSYDSKVIIKQPPHTHSPKKYAWKPGINLITYLMYNGAYPHRNDVKKMLKEIQDNSHNDWTANNMILQGNKLALIDWYDPNHNSVNRRPCSAKTARIHEHFIGLKNPEEVKEYFWNVIAKNN